MMYIEHCNIFMVATFGTTCFFVNPQGFDAVIANSIAIVIGLYSLDSANPLSMIFARTTTEVQTACCTPSIFAGSALELLTTICTH
ncbi:MAG: hypothetical protein AUK03_04860 [Anaerolineae bacterium CG2_30_64_16]|nr:MAG: hypothetical protein AUK03_04860 [Anaerolineae bacterium CG2_30_64_16]